MPENRIPADPTDEILNLVRRSYPSWSGFDQPEFADDEIGYKRTAAALAQELIDREAFEKLLREENHGELLDRLGRVARATNLLYLGTPSSGDLAVLHAADLDPSAFCRIVFDLLYGEGDGARRLDRFSGYLEEHQLPNKWTFPTYFLFLLHPEEEFFVKPSVTRWFLGLADPGERYASRPSGKLYSTILRIVGQLREGLADYTPSDMIDLQSIVWVAYSANRERARHRPSRAKVREFEELYGEFVRDYLETSTGTWHLEAYRSGRASGQKSYAEILEASRQGEDVTERVLLELLPHADTADTREKGAWIHVAPAISGNLKRWFESSGRRQPEDWDKVAEAILRFLGRVVENPAALEDACAEFSALPWSKGFQTGMLTPILNALRPDDFLLVNNKSRLLVNYLADTSFSQKLTDYPDVNRAGQDVVAHLADVLEGATGADASAADLFDAYSHWFVAVRKVPIGQPRYFKIAPGKDARFWEAWRDGGYAAIGWSELRNLTHASRAEFERRRDALVEKHDDGTASETEQVWRFLHVREGDRLVANQGTRRVLGIGTVTGPYEFVRGAEHGHRLPVDWDDTEPRGVEEPGWIPTLVELDEEKFRSIVEAAPASPDPEKNFQREVPLLDVAVRTCMDVERLQRWVRAIERKKQAILYGPPGTGKTFTARHLARHLVGGGDGFVELVQFHPSYAYEDFIQGIRPEESSDGFVYRLKKGRFLEFCEKAQSASGTAVLIIDEINRAQLSRVFGELMYLLEYRWAEIPLASGGRFSIPDNVRILGTMNTADRSIALVDHALRRRFAFLRLAPEPEILRRFQRSDDFPVEKLIELLERLNREIADPHYEVGVTFFLREELGEEIEDIWTMEIEPYLEEYFFDQPEKVSVFRWDAIRSGLGFGRE